MRGTERRLARLELRASPATSEPMNCYTDAERRHSLACFYSAVIRQCELLGQAWGEPDEWEQAAVAELGQDWRQYAELGRERLLQ